MKKINKNILIATGGTGGHIFPSLSLAKFLTKDYNLQIVSDNRGLKFLQNNGNIKIKIINSGTIYKKNFLHIIFGASKIITAFIYSVCFLIYSRPNLIIGMGGYSSFPICIAGFLLRIPVIIYENNLIIGRANKFLLPIVKKIILSTKNTSGINPKYKKKLSVCGYILNENIYNFNNPKKISNSYKEISI